MSSTLVIEREDLVGNSLSLAIVDGISESTISPRISADDLSSTLVNPRVVRAVEASASWIRSEPKVLTNEVNDSALSALAP